MNFSNWTSKNAELKKNPYISTYRYVDIETKEELGNSTNLVFIDLHSFDKKEEECESMEEIWMYSIKNMHSFLTCPAKIIGTEIEDLYVKSELAKMTVEQRKKYETDIMTRNDILNSIAEQLEDARAEAEKIGLAEGLSRGMEEGLEQGIQQGVAQGVAQGRAEEKADMIRLMHSKGMSAEAISELIELNLEEIKAILN